MKRFDWEDIISMDILILKIVGLWPRDLYKVDFYALYAIISVVLGITAHVLFQTINVIFVYTNLEALTEMILVCVAEILALLKIYTFIRNIGMMKSLLVSLGSDLFQPRNSRQILLVQPAIRLWKMLYRTMLGAVFPVATLWLIFPILNGSVRQHVLPFLAWYPYDLKVSCLYQLTYLHQIVGTSLLALADYNIDMLISALMMYVGAQCDILCDNLRNLGTNSKDFAKMLKHCVVHHKQILRFAENCNDFFSFIMLGQFFTSAVCMAMALYRLVMVTPLSLQFYALLCTIWSMIMEIFTYCWFGEEVASKSSKIAYAAFESAWIPQQLAVKRCLVIFSERMQIPIKLSTFKLFYLSLDTFVRIFRSAVSYYTVLRQFGGR